MSADSGRLGPINTITAAEMHPFTIRRLITPRVDLILSLAPGRVLPLGFRGQAIAIRRFVPANRVTRTRVSGNESLFFGQCIGELNRIVPTHLFYRTIGTARRKYRLVGAHDRTILTLGDLPGLNLKTTAQGHGVGRLLVIVTARLLSRTAHGEAAR